MPKSVVGWIVLIVILVVIFHHPAAAGAWVNAAFHSVTTFFSTAVGALP
jgi:hypothetical protein